ncbi:MAG: glycosyltransferase family 39 protein, partial [Thermomicrobiales bacterium]
MTVVDARAQTAAPATTAAPAAAPATVPQLPRRVGKVTAPRRDRRKASETETGWSKPLLWRVAAMIVVLIAFLTPRLIELDRMVTPDEPIWLARSANFYEALSSGDLGSTYQFAHPGVTVMWLGAAGYWWKARDYASQVDGQISQRLNRVARYLEEFGYAPLDVLVAGRIMLVLAMALVFAAAFLYALRLMTFSVAVLGFLLIALDPFALALSRLLHVDAMSAMMMLLCVLSGTVYLVRGRKRGDLLLSGIAAGLAVLTRSQMGILAVWFPLMLLIDARGWRLGGGNWIASLRSCVRPLAIWGSAAFITCVVLWPALWVDPLRVIEGMLDFAGTAAIEGHERTIVFAGELHAGDPGVRFYPATFLWRATPSVLIGITLAIVALVWARRWQV